MAVVAVTVVEGGKVSRVDIVEERPQGEGFGAIAKEAIMKWEFKTAQPGVYKVTVNFRDGKLRQ